MLVWYQLFCNNIRVSIRNLFVFYISRVWVLIWWYSCFRYHGIYAPCKNLHSIYLGSIGLVPIWSRMVPTQIVTRVYNFFLMLTYPWNINISNGITIHGRFFDTIVEVDYWYHGFTYILDQHWFIPAGSWLGLSETNSSGNKLKQKSLQACFWKLWHSNQHISITSEMTNTQSVATNFHILQKFLHWWIDKTAFTQI